MVVIPLGITVILVLFSAVNAFLPGGRGWRLNPNRSAARETMKKLQPGWILYFLFFSLGFSPKFSPGFQGFSPGFDGDIRIYSTSGD